jgi:hypothetical protein
MEDSWSFQPKFYTELVKLFPCDRDSSAIHESKNTSSL